VKAQEGVQVKLRVFLTAIIGGSEIVYAPAVLPLVPLIFQTPVVILYILYTSQGLTVQNSTFCLQNVLVLQQQVQLHGVMAQKANHNTSNFALDDEVSGQFQPTTALSAIPIGRRLVGSQSQSGRRDSEYAA
jgi:hypothetical protein